MPDKEALSSRRMLENLVVWGNMDRMRMKTVAFLRWSEKYFKTDMVYLTSGNFWMLAGRLVGTGSGIILTLAFANLLPKEVFGIYKYVISAAGFLMAFSLPGLGTAIVRAVAQGSTGIIKKTLPAGLRWSLIGSTLALGGAGYYFVMGNIVLGTSFTLIALYLFFSNYGGLAKSFLQGKKDFKGIQGLKLL